MKFEKDLGWYFPDHEAHLQGWMRQMKQELPEGRIGYQLHKYQAIRNHIKHFRHAVDIGSHIGLWAFPMSFDFDAVTCFEPMSDHRECWRENMKERKNATLVDFALGNENKTGWIRTRTPDSSGDTGIEPKRTKGSKKVEIRRLDDLNLKTVDFIKVDCEGFEYYVMEGAKETILRCEPVICIEQKPNRETGVTDRYGIDALKGLSFLESLGMKKVGGLQGDYFLTF